MSQPSRRLILALALGAGAAGVGGLLRITHYPDQDMQGWIREILERHLPGQDIPDSALTPFTRMFLATSEAYNRRHRLFALAEALVPEVPVPSQSIRERIGEFERQVVSEFLLTTTFFRNDGTRHRALNHVGHWEGCANPFAQFD